MVKSMALGRARGLWGNLLLKGLFTHNRGRGSRGPSELGVVVPTGFEPVFEPDLDFALFYAGLGDLIDTWFQTFNATR
jgi:hypothetical protein